MTKAQEDRLVDDAFRVLEPAIKGYLRAAVRKGSSIAEASAKLSQFLTAGQSIGDAVSGITSAVGGIVRAVNDVQRARGSR